MSSGYISEDGKTVSFEVNLGRKLSRITIMHIDKNPESETDKDRIVIKMETTDVSNIDSQFTTYTQHIIDKNYSKVFAHFLTNASKTIEEWYEDEKKK